MRKIRKTDLITILVITFVFVVIVAMNSAMLFRSMKDQTQQIGQAQINNIRTDFENDISSAEYSLIRVSSGAEQILREGDNRDELERYIVSQKKMQIESSLGVNFNVYIAGQGWEIIPDFDAPEDYHATERNWYVGALENKGNIFITDPYVDSMTGEMCYTMSILLQDGVTVVAMDFTLSEIQKSVEKMSLEEDSAAMIVASNGLIVGYTDMSYVGKELKKSLPEYVDAFENIRSNRIEESFTTKIDGNRRTIFYSMTKNNWYMIVSVNDGEHYRSTFRQVVINILISIAMLILIIVLYIFNVRSRVRMEEVQRSRELFVAGIVKRLKEPLNDILRTSDHGTGEDANTKEEFANIKASGLRMGEIMNDLSSYSSIAAKRERNSIRKGKFSRDMSSIMKRFRNIIIVILVVLMVISSYLYYYFGRNESDNLMKTSLSYYKYQLQQWEKEQMTILSMFTDVIAAEPERMDDYESAVAWMDSVAKHYESISVCYLANPYKEHTVIMNNGWQPDEGWKVEERDWYRKTEKSGTGYSISAPYYDEQTGNYCITFSRMVYGSKGEFLGIFGIDLYMDKIIKIFGDSYTELEYVFLLDSNGDIINHPNTEWQMSEKVKVNVKDTPYVETYNDENSGIQSFTDYDGKKRCSVMAVEKDTGFSIMVVWNWSNVFLYRLFYAVLFGAFVLVVIIIIIVLINKLIRSQVILNQELSDAVSEATAAGKAKTDFLAQMSHEIRTPINAVIGMDEMILRESEDPQIREYALDIRSAGKTLLSLINGILDFSKIENGKMEIMPVKYDTTAMLDNLVNMISDRAEKKNLELLLEVDEKIPRTLYGDDVRIRQVITNLLTNAVKYTEKGSVTLSIQSDVISNKECILYVDVRDTGIGIREEDMEKLFQSFQRLDESRNRTIEGTGLGMSIVDGLLKLMGSSLEVKSEYGKGSSFSFRLRQGIIDGIPIGAYKRHRGMEEEISVGKKNLRILKADILVVDDNEMNLKVAKSLMKRLHVVPDLAGSGRAALEMVRNKHYDIILMDHMMPDMDGIETLRTLRKESILFPDTAVVALTANAISGAREMYLAEGFRDYLSKPIDPDELEHVLTEYLPNGQYVWEDPETAAENAEESGEEEKPEEQKREEVKFLRGDEEGMIGEMRERGFNVESAMKYAMNDEEVYQEVLEAFVLAAAEKQPEIREAREERNWEKYQIQVHSLKSTSRTIGADKLSAMAKEQEEAAAESKVDVMEKGYEPMMEEYDRVIGLIREVVSIAEPDGEDGEILEFFPD